MDPHHPLIRTEAVAAPPRRLGGWWRLWIALALVHGLALAAWNARHWPTLDGLPHQPELVTQMSAPAQAVLSRPPARPFGDLVDALVLGDRAGAEARARRFAQTIYERVQDPAWATLGNVALVMPNRQRFEVAAETPAADQQLVRDEYVRVLTQRRDALRRALVRHALAWWAAPLLGLLAAGLLVQWVRRGFAPATR